MDEPTNNLDIYHASNMMKMVRKLSDELGKTVILVLHEINYAAFIQIISVHLKTEKSRNMEPLKKSFKKKSFLRFTRWILKF